MAALAHECLATYIVRGMSSPSLLPIDFRLRLTLPAALRYCLLSSVPGALISGRRNGEVPVPYLETMLCIQSSHLI